MVALIAAGFVLGRGRMAAAGAALMFLPVFAQFATVMFFLAGLGLLNLVWLPVLDIGFDVGRLGDIVYLPYRALVRLGGSLGVDLHGPLVVLLVGGGLLLFAAGTLAWFVARTRDRDVADFWVYRVSRHPQYLGWLLWSYGMLVALERIQYPRRSWGIPSSLPWLLSAMIIIGVALLEEEKMRRLFGASYESYRAKTPFLLPLPSLLNRVLTAPCRLLFGRDFPSGRGQIAAVLGLYTALLIGLSFVSLEVRAALRLPEPARSTVRPDDRAAELATAIRQADTWHARAPLVAALEAEGEPALGSLLDLLGDPDPELRQIAARGLGRIGSERAVDPLLDSLADDDENVRHWSISALGEIGDPRAVETLLALLDGDAPPHRGAAADALGRIGSAAAVEPLIAVLDDPRPWVRAAVVEALGRLGSARVVAPLASLLADEGEDVHVRRAVATAFARIRSPDSKPALEAALSDDDREVRMYAAEALKLLGDSSG
jgi:HEAT repeat protein/protein-S-isoprenylcysteine O-methyltransferase Ste14